MGKERLAAFSDGVIAIIITIMVLEFRPPHGGSFSALRPLLPVFLTYVLSFVNVAIYWNNHHHFLAAVDRVNGAILWANIHLLFWLSLFPFATAWMGENQAAPAPTAVYGIVLLAAALAWWIMQRAMLAEHGKSSLLATALGRDFKGNVSPLIYLCAVGLAFVHSWIAQALYAVVALMWLVPDRRVERVVTARPPERDQR